VDVHRSGYLKDSIDRYLIRPVQTLSLKQLWQPMPP
jgi:hypothetical protein